MAKLISIGQIIDKSWEHYIEHFKVLINISLLSFIVGALMIIRIIVIPEGELLLLIHLVNYGLPTLAIIRLIVGSFISLIAIPVIATWIFLTLIQVIKQQFNHETVDVKKTKRQSWNILIKYIITMAIKGLTLASPLLFIAPGIILTIINQNNYQGPTFSIIEVIFIILGIILALYYIIKLTVNLTFTSFTFLFEDKRNIKALTASKKLVTNRWWKTAVRIIIPKLVFGFFVVIGEIIISILSILIPLTAFQIGDWFGVYGTIALVGILTITLQIFYIPIFIIADFIVYDSLKKSK